VEWRRSGGYDARALTELCTGTDARTRIVLKTVEQRVTDPHAMRGLGFACR
jgi:hypothetical protein